jgi:hypothetical protein
MCFLHTSGPFTNCRELLTTSNKYRDGLPELRGVAMLTLAELIGRTCTAADLLDRLLTRPLSGTTEVRQI